MNYAAHPLPTLASRFILTAFAVLYLCKLVSTPAEASIAYGSINNFDTVNDTGHECHGFEIEIEDCHSTDITYTYNYNHYGVFSASRTRERGPSEARESPGDAASDEGGRRARTPACDRGHRS